MDGVQITASYIGTEYSIRVGCFESRMWFSLEASGVRPYKQSKSKAAPKPGKLYIALGVRGEIYG